MADINQLFETIGSYLDAIVYLLNEKEIITDTELHLVLTEIVKQNERHKKNMNDSYTANVSYISGFMNPKIGEA